MSLSKSVKIIAHRHFRNFYFPHVQMGQLLKNHHLLSVTLEHPIPVLRRFTHFHWVHLVSAPEGRSSLASCAMGVAGGGLESLSFHTVILMHFGDVLTIAKITDNQNAKIYLTQ